MSSTIRTPCPSRSRPQNCTASQMDGSPNASPAWIVKWALARRYSNASRCRVGGTRPPRRRCRSRRRPRSRYATASSAISRERAAVRIAVSSGRDPDRAARGRAATSPCSNPSQHRLDDLAQREPAGPRAARGRTAPRRRRRRRRRGPRAHSRGDPRERVAGLHDGDGVGERLEVALQRAGVGGVDEPARQRLGVGRRQPVVADLAGELDDRRGAQRRRRGGRAAAPSAPGARPAPAASRGCPPGGRAGGPRGGSARSQHSLRQPSAEVRGPRPSALNRRPQMADARTMESHATVDDRAGHDHTEVIRPAAVLPNRAAVKVLTHLRWDDVSNRRGLERVGVGVAALRPAVGRHRRHPRRRAS